MGSAMGTCRQDAPQRGACSGGAGTRLSSYRKRSSQSYALPARLNWCGNGCRCLGRGSGTFPHPRCAPSQRVPFSITHQLNVIVNAFGSITIAPN